MACLWVPYVCAGERQSSHAGTRAAQPASRPAGKARRGTQAELVAGGAAANPTRRDAHARTSPAITAGIRADLAGFPCWISGQVMERECDLLARRRALHAGASGRLAARAADKTCPAGVRPCRQRLSSPPLDLAWLARGHRSFGFRHGAPVVRRVRAYHELGQLARRPQTSGGQRVPFDVVRAAGPGSNGVASDSIEQAVAPEAGSAFDILP